MSYKQKVDNIMMKMSFAKKLQLLKAQNEEGKHLSPDWQPKETDDKPTG